MNYTHLDQLERYKIQELKVKGLSMRSIAKNLNRSPATISRELKRNVRMKGSHLYEPGKAGEHARARRWRSRQGMRFILNNHSKILEKLKDDWSPEQIVYRLRIEGERTPSHETLYKAIWLDKKQGGELYKHLRQSVKIRRKRHNSKDSRGILKGKRQLSERPLGCKNRTELGHFEIDLVHGDYQTKSCILTLVDRKSRYLIIRILKNKKAKTVNKYLKSIIKKHHMKTISADNGVEWHHYKKLEKQTNCLWYFARPYHSWERGTNENTNGLIRQYLPKRTSMEHITQIICNRIAKKINRRPRKILNWKTNEEAHLYDDESVALQF